MYEDTDEGRRETITSHLGIQESDSTLDLIFIEHFPDLQRRSALITLFSFSEHQIDNLCKRYAEEKIYALRLSDLAGNGIDRNILYLEKVAGLSSIKGIDAWQEVTNIQKIRNCIVHNDGKLKGKDEKATKGN